MAEVTATSAVGAYELITRARRRRAARPAAGPVLHARRGRSAGAGRTARPYLPRAFSFARARAAPGGGAELDFLLEDVGPGTRRLGELRAGRGAGAARPARRRLPPPGRRAGALLVGGGIGVAPLLCLRDELGPRRAGAARLPLGRPRRGRRACSRRAGAGDRRRLGRPRRRWSPSRCARSSTADRSRHRLRLRPAADARGRAGALRGARRAGPARARVRHGLRLRRLLRLRRPDRATATCASASTGRSSTPTALSRRLTPDADA